MEQSIYTVHSVSKRPMSVSNRNNALPILSNLSLPFSYVYCFKQSDLSVERGSSVSNFDDLASRYQKAAASHGQQHHGAFFLTTTGPLHTLSMVYGRRRRAVDGVSQSDPCPMEIGRSGLSTARQELRFIRRTAMVAASGRHQAAVDVELEEALEIQKYGGAQECQLLLADGGALRATTAMINSLTPSIICVEPGGEARNLSRL